MTKTGLRIFADALEQPSRAPYPRHVRDHFSDGSVAFFLRDLWRGDPETTIARVVDGRQRAAEFRMSDGSLVFVRRRGA